MDIDDVLNINLRETIKNITYLKRSLHLLLKDTQGLKKNKDLIIYKLNEIKTNYAPIIDAKIIYQTKIHKVLTFAFTLPEEYFDIKKSVSTIFDILQSNIMKEIFRVYKFD